MCGGDEHELKETKNFERLKYVRCTPSRLEKIGHGIYYVKDALKGMDTNKRLKNSSRAYDVRASLLTQYKEERLRIPTWWMR